MSTTMNANPQISKKEESNNKLTFVLSNVDVSIANGIRRTILSDIPTIVFRTTPNEENKAVITANTSRLNNEILKQRLSCIPINLSNHDYDYKTLLLEINEENITNSLYVVTTEHFKIKDKITGKYLPRERVREVFPPYISLTGQEYYIDFVKLRPTISTEIVGEKIQLTCEFSIGDANENCMFNVVSTCAYGFTQDENYTNTDGENQLTIFRETCIKNGDTPELVNFNTKNWQLLQGKRYVIQNSFDFVIESVGVYTNDKIVYLACKILINKFTKLINYIMEGKMGVHKNTTLTRLTFDYVLANEDYTIGNILNHLLFVNYYEGSKTLSYCGFKKMHPHDLDSIIRITFNSIGMEELEGEDVYLHKGGEYLVLCCKQAIELLRIIMKKFVSHDEAETDF